jgi:hypothetical protein
MTLGAAPEGRFSYLEIILGADHPRPPRRLRGPADRFKETALYALTIFLGAFLVFQIQPLIARYLLPWYGGARGVWTACILFFQVMLVAGYAYAHWVSRLRRPRNQAAIHLLLLALSVPPENPI